MKTINVILNISDKSVFQHLSVVFNSIIPER